MTNAEKYLKDGVKEQLIKELSIYGGELDEFFEEQAKPTLTEDERVILRNIDKRYTRIGRYKENDFKGENEDNNLVGQLYVGQAKYGINMPLSNVFWGVFQFIKEGEEYEIKELLNETEQERKNNFKQHNNRQL